MFEIDNLLIRVRDSTGAWHAVHSHTAHILELRAGQAVDDKTAAQIVVHETALLHLYVQFNRLNEQRRIMKQRGTPRRAVGGPSKRTA